MNPKMENLFWFKIDMQDFRICSNVIVNQSQNLTKNHLDEIGSWSSNQYDNSTLISVTGAFIPRFENLLNSFQNMTYPPNSEYVHNALVNSLKYETGSYKQFRNYLLSGNKKKIPSQQICYRRRSCMNKYILNSFQCLEHCNL
jgi:hypothetical protein